MSYAKLRTSLYPVPVPAIPARDMRPDLVNALTPDAQWDYKRGRAVPKVPLPRGCPNVPFCDVNALRDYHAAERAAKAAPAAAARPRRSLRARVVELEAFIRAAGLTVPEAVAA